MHRYLLQDMYPWAGETQQDWASQEYRPAVNVRADYLLTHTNHRRISYDVEALAAQLATENNLKSLTKL